MNLNRIKTYCGKPIEVSRAGYLYPVRILEWEEFTKLAGRFLMTSDEFLRKRLKLEEEIKLFDFITLQAIMTSKTGFENLKEMEQLFSIVFRSEVKANLRGRVGNKEVYFIVDGKGIIDRNNYEEVRSIIMEQNLLFDPIVAKTAKSQEVIDRGIGRLRRGNPTVDVEAMIVVVSLHKNINLDELTYYQLRADYEIITKIEANRAIPLYRVNGAEVDMYNLTDELSIHNNPYGADALFRKRNDGEMLNKLQG